MDLPFSVEQFLGVFSDYNTSVWPAQIALNLLAIAAIIFALTGEVFPRIVAGILALFWAWTGVVYFLLFFGAISKGAVLYSVLYLIQAFFFVWTGIIKQTLKFGAGKKPWNVVGGFFVTYALVMYPVLGYFVGHVYPHSPTFGAPCPITIFTLGLLMWTGNRAPRWIFVIPILWSLVGFSAVLFFGIYEDVGLLLAGFTGVVYLVGRKAAPVVATAV